MENSNEKNSITTEEAAAVPVWHMEARLITERNLLMTEKYPEGFSHEDDYRTIFEDHEDDDK